MKIHEYQGKEILKRFGVPVPRGIPCFSVDEAVKAAETLAELGRWSKLLRERDDLLLIRSAQDVRRAKAEGLGFTACDSEEWLAHKGTVGRVMFGDLHIVDDEMNEVPVGQSGTIWFKTATPFEYHNDADKTREATSSDGTMTTVNDVDE